MAERIHIVVNRAEKERYRRLATREGKTLSEWFRAAAQEKLAAAEMTNDLSKPDGLRAFFEEIDRRRSGVEPDWEAQKKLIEESKTKGLALP